MNDFKAIRRATPADGFLVEGLTRRASLEQGAEGAQLVARHDQVRLVDFYAGLGYERADDVALTAPNPRSPPPIGMRKTFRMDT